MSKAKPKATARLAVRLPPAELEAVRSAAKADFGRSVTNWVRSVLAKATTPPPRESAS